MAEGESGGGDVELATEAGPDELWTGRNFRRAVVVAAQVGDQFHVMLQPHPVRNRFDILRNHRNARSHD